MNENADLEVSPFDRTFERIILLCHLKPNGLLSSMIPAAAVDADADWCATADDGVNEAKPLGAAVLTEGMDWPKRSVADSLTSMFVRCGSSSDERNKIAKLLSGALFFAM